MKKVKNAWLYHPGLVNRVRGLTGRYRPAPNHPVTGDRQIEIEQVLSKKDFLVIKIDGVEMLPEEERS